MDDSVESTSRPSRVHATHHHAQPPFRVEEVARGAHHTTPYTFESTNAVAAATTPAAASPFAPFSPSELQPYSSPSPATAASAASPKKLGAGFSPRHAHWDPSHEYDEVYSVEPSPQSSPQSSPRHPSRPHSSAVSPVPSPAPLQPRVLMSPSTRSAADSLVPSLSWLLILNRKLAVSGAITADQSRHLKREILDGRPELLSAVQRFVKQSKEQESQDAIIEALINCLPEVGEQEKSTAPDESYAQDSDDATPAASASESDDEDYRAILGSGRGEGGHKSKSRPRALGDDDLNGSRIDFAHSSASDSDDDENPLLVANSLLPLSLPQLESLHALLRQLGFHLIDLETLQLCTSTLLPDTSSDPPPRTTTVADSVSPVTLTAWIECVKSLRLHSHSPKLFTQVMIFLFRALDLHQTESVPYGELVSSVAVFCRATRAQRVRYIYVAMTHSNRTTPASVTASATSPNGRAAAASSLACTSIYGFLFSFSLTLHALLQWSAIADDTDCELVDVDPAAVGAVVNLHHRGVWLLTNNLYALLDEQFAPAAQADEDDEQADADATLSYEQWTQWRYSPVVVLDTLLEQAEDDEDEEEAATE